MSDQALTESVISLLKLGYAQGTVARRTGLSKQTVGVIARKFNVGRRPGDTRMKVRRETLEVIKGWNSCD